MVLFFGLVFPIPPGKFSADTLGSMFLSVAQEAQQGGKCGHAPRGAGLGGVSIHFIQTFKKRVFLQKLREKYA